MQEVSFERDRNYSPDAPSEDLHSAEVRYRRLFETACEGILMLDAESCRVTDVNPFFCEMLGYSHGELIGKELWELGRPEDRAAHTNAFRELTQYADFPLLTKNGVCRSVAFVNLAYQENGRTVVQCHVRDNTTHQQTEGELRLLKQAIDSIGEGVIVCDAQNADYPTIYANAAFEKLTGYTFDEIRGRNCRFLQGEKTDWQVVGEISRTLAQGKTFRGEILNYRKDGTNFWNELIISPIFDQSGLLTNFVGVQKDITERKIAEDALRSSEVRFQIFCETAPLGVFLADDQGQCLFSNRYLQNLTGLSDDELRGLGWATVIHPEDQKWVAEQWIECAAKGIQCFQEYRFLPADKVVRWINVRTVPVKFADHQPIKHVGIVEDITERKNSEELLRLAEAKYRNIVESLPAIVYLAEPIPPYSPIYVSPNIEIFGYPVEEWLSKTDMWLSILHHEDRARILNLTDNAMRDGEETDLEYRVTAHDGSIRWLHDKGRFVTDELGNRIYWQGVMLDITPTKELEEQLRQSQKLESVGLLAGGIAHDFNNMLTAINGYSDLSLRRIADNEPLRRNIEAIKQAGVRSAALTNQLLAFSRQQVLQPSIFKVAELINEPVKMLARLIGEDVQMAINLHPQSGSVKVDAGQFSQIIINLAVNARDAMPQGGTLTIETANIFLKPNQMRQRIGFLPGAYVVLTVRDTGIGMSDEIKQHIFEPFFTTKKVGHGTGLGLATVYGIVKQSGGHIEVESKEGDGTTFRIYFPRVTNAANTAARRNASPEMPQGTETILLVEDEELVRNLSTDILRTCGYSVMTAVNGLEALKLCENDDCHFDLLMTDVVMPQMGGRELAEKLTAKIPNLPILFTSGYTDDAVVRHGVIENSTNFIQKPFTPQALAQKLKEILDQTVRAKSSKPPVSD